MADPRPDFLPLAPDGVTVLKDKMLLYVEAEEFFIPSVRVNFKAFFTDSNGQSREITFQENLTAEPSKTRDPNSSKKACRIAWDVNLHGDKEAMQNACTVIFTVHGEAESGRRLVALSQDKIIIRPILLTTDPKLTRIMYHEFSRPKASPPPGDEDPFEFNPHAVQAYINTLSPQQKKLLLNYKVNKPEGRLVVFVTLYAQKPLRMCADYCDKGVKCARPNATFSVFHCLGPEKDPVLVCHTEHFLVNLFNPDTNAWVHGAQKGKPAREWLRKSNPQPPQFKIGSILPQAMCDGVIWSRIFTPEGRDIMPGNTMHGMINTIGCWMLFRNYNWPINKVEAFDHIYRHLGRALGRSGKSRVIAALAKEGYDAPKDLDAGLSGSLSKFANFDRNFAYLWFFHEIVGIKYFSSQINYVVAGRDVNDFRPHSRTFSNNFHLNKVDAAPKFNLPDEEQFAYHDSVQRVKDDTKSKAVKKFVPDNTLWRQNVLGLQTAEGFLPQTFGNMSKDQAERFTWADLYIYAEDNVDITKMKTNYSEPRD
jgi:hypothetical protein